MANKDNKILVERETFVKNDKTYFSYFIKGTVRGKEVRVAIVPPDKGGYTVLDIVFGEEKAVELSLRPFEIKDSATGNTIKGNTYFVRTEEDGMVYECPVKPMRQSDKYTLNMLLAKNA